MTAATLEPGAPLLSPVDLDRGISLALRDHPMRVEWEAEIRRSTRAALRRGDLLPLLPRHHIHLWVRAGDGPRFARLFLAT